MKIGVYGGTFNPPHLGHVTAARAVSELLKLDKLLFIPAGLPPHKPLPEGTPSPEQRLEMTRLAAEQTGGSLSIESTLGVGTAVTAVFVASHIDCPPVGDMAGTITLLIQGAPELELHYTHRRGDALARLDTKELRALLGPELSLAEPELILWIRDYLQEQEALLQEQKGM